MASIEIDRVGKSFDGLAALSGIDLHVADGEFLVMLGPSGCGKSTLLRMVAGLEDITRGEIRFDGRRVNELSTQKRNISMVFQNYALYPHKSVSGNLEFGLRVRGAERTGIAERIREAASMLGIEALLSRRPRQLSGGQRQRVAMGRSIVRSPEAFLFDEPLSNLDAKLRNQMRIEIRQLQRRLGTTALYVTHDQVEAMTLADRVVVLNGGRIEQVADPIALYATPATLFVADFVGTHPMNFLDPDIEADGTLRVGDLRWRPPSSPPAGTTVKLGIRPEHLVIDPASPARLLAEFVEPLGSDTMVHASIDGQAVTLRTDPEHRVREGDMLPVRVDVAKLHLFDTRSGRRL